MFGKKIKKTIKIDGMHCSHCSGAVSEALNALDGVKAKVSLEDACAYVTVSEGSYNEDALKKAVSDAGFTAVSIE